jgi:hypothetical protein
MRDQAGVGEQVDGSAAGVIGGARSFQVRPLAIMKKKQSEQKHLHGSNFASRKFRPHVTALGQLIFAWNDLHEQLAAFIGLWLVTRTPLLKILPCFCEQGECV